MIQVDREWSTANKLTVKDGEDGLMTVRGDGNGVF